MVLLLDTTEEKIGSEVLRECGLNKKEEVELIDTTEMNISNCNGCNFCWLKTPGECTLKDDYEPILKKISSADQVWLISDTKFGFISYKAKNIVDRISPIITTFLHYNNKKARHIMRYDRTPDLGVIYSGEGNDEFLNRWCDRLASDLGSSSRGAYGREKIKEAVSCM